MATPTIETKKCLEPSGEFWGQDDAYVTYGTAIFVTTATSLELDIPHNSIDCILLMPKTATYDADDYLSSDGTITTNAVTVFRNSGAAGSSACEIWYMVIGPILTTTS